MSTITTTITPEAEQCPAPIHRPPTPAPPFRFLDLPAELQNHVVNFFIVSRHPITVHAPRFNRHPSPPPKARSRPRLDKHVAPTPPLSREGSTDSAEFEEKKNAKTELGHTRLALMLTCRKLYREHWAIYYGGNTFSFLNLHTFQDFLKALPKRCIAQLRSLSFHMPLKHHHDRAWELLAGLKRLEELEFWLHRPSQAADQEWKEAIQGVNECKMLRRFTIRRLREDGKKEEEQEEDEEAEGETEDNVLKKDRQVEAQINSYLREREDKGQVREKLKVKEDEVEPAFPADESDE